MAWIVDTLASRYGWTKKQILEELYWEEMWEQVKVAANVITYEKNQELFFNYCIHATSKDAMKHWKDSPLPFPVKSNIKRRELHYGGLDQLPSHIRVKKVNLNNLNNLKKDGKQN